MESEGLGDSGKEERQRAREDQEMYERAKDKRWSKRMIALVSWELRLESKKELRHYQHRQEIVRKEVYCAAMACIRVRRAAMKKLIEKERAMYEEELAAKNIAFNKQRF